MTRYIFNEAQPLMVRLTNGKYRAWYDIEPKSEEVTTIDPATNEEVTTTVTTYCCGKVDFDTLPTIREIRERIPEAINDDTDEKILSGFTYNGHRVWLSLEDQMNYKGAYDLCVQTGGQGVLPLTIKIGTTDNPHYETFDTVEGFTAFYLSMFAYIQQTLSAGWAKKDAVNYEEYDTALRAIAANDND